jgi:hypothetical protein
MHYVNISIKASTDLELAVGQSFSKLEVLNQPKAVGGKLYFLICSGMLDPET